MYNIAVLGLIVSLSPLVAAGPGGPACFVLCAEVCAPSGIAGVGYFACYAACIPPCFAGTCMSNETLITAKEGEQPVSKYIEDIKGGDTILTLKNEEQYWTKVLRNIKTEGSFEFVQITAQSLGNTSHIKKIQVTPEHGLIFLNSNNPMTIDTAEHVEIGDRLPDATGDIFSVVEISRTTLDTKYTLETCEGTVLASDFYVTTVCNEVVAGGEHLFGSTMNEWQSNHSFLC